METFLITTVVLLISTEFFSCSDGYDCDERKNFPVNGLTPRDFECKEPGTFDFKTFRNPTNKTYIELEI